jgi:hypothetical protein
MSRYSIKNIIFYPFLSARQLFAIHSLGGTNRIEKGHRWMQESAFVSLKMDAR